MCTACFDPFNMKPIPEGEYIYTRPFNNDKVEGIEYFSSAKVIIKEITEEEYLLANGVNVFIDVTPPKSKRYLGIEAYLFSIDTNLYEPVTISNLSYRHGTHHIYDDGTFQININGIILEGNAEMSFNTGSEKGSICFSIYNENFKFVTYICEK